MMFNASDKTHLDAIDRILREKYNIGDVSLMTAKRKAAVERRERDESFRYFTIRTRLLAIESKLRLPPASAIELLQKVVAETSPTAVAAES